MTDPFAIVAARDGAALTARLAADPAAAAATNGAGASLLSVAVYHGWSEGVQTIRAALPRLSPWEAIVLGDEAALRAALAEGWDANALAPDGFPPLALAAFFRQDAIFDLLLPRTADLDRRARNGQQVAAIHAATAAGRGDMVEKLLAAGADPDLRQQDGVTPLHAAAHRGDAALAGLLLLAGADPRLADDTGRTAEAFAAEVGHTWLAARLRHAAGTDAEAPPG